MPTQAVSSSSNAGARGSTEPLGSGAAFYTKAPASSSSPSLQVSNQEQHDRKHSATPAPSVQKISKQHPFEKQKEFPPLDSSSSSSTSTTTTNSSSNSSPFLSTQFMNMQIDGINPYVEQQESDAEDEEYGDYEEYDDDDEYDDSEHGNQSIEEWENPSYLVKNLDTGESYNVEEIDLHYNLVTLDVVAAQHESKWVAHYAICS